MVPTTWGPGSDEIRPRHFSSGDFSTGGKPPASAGIPLEPAMTSSSGFFVGIFLGQNWGFCGSSPMFFSFVFESLFHGCEITTFSSLAGMVTMSFFRERNSWSCFMGKAWQSFPSGFESPNWLHELSATLPLNFLSSKVHYIHTPKVNSSALKNGAWKTIHPFLLVCFGNFSGASCWVKHITLLYWFRSTCVFWG